jgi:type I restriction enzyme S subunit
MVPNGWEEKALNSVAKVYDGTHATPTYVKSGVPFFSVEHLTRKNFTETKFISEEVFLKENKRVRLEQNDILMTRIGDIGTVKLLNWDVRASFYVSLALIKLNGNFRPRFAEHYLQSNEFQRELWARMIHVAFPKKINLGEIGKCRVRMPPLLEQRKISDILSTWDQAIEKTEALLSNARTQKRALMQQLLTGKRRFSAFEGQPWKEVRLGEISTSWSGGTPSRKKPEFYGGNIPWIKSGEVNAVIVSSTSETITEDGLRNSSARMVKQGNILVAMYGATAGVVSISGIDAAINQAILAIDPSEGVDNAFLHRSIEFAMETTKRLTQGGQPNLNAAIIRSAKIFLPEINEQQTIAIAVDEAEREILGLTKQFEQLRTEKKALMQQLLTGKRRVVV